MWVYEEAESLDMKWQMGDKEIASLLSAPSQVSTCLPPLSAARHFLIWVSPGPVPLSPGRFSPLRRASFDHLKSQVILIEKEGLCKAAERACAILSHVHRCSCNHLMVWFDMHQVITRAGWPLDDYYYLEIVDICSAILLDTTTKHNLLWIELCMFNGEGWNIGGRQAICLLLHVNKCNLRSIKGRKSKFWSFKLISCGTPIIFSFNLQTSLILKWT